MRFRSKRTLVAAAGMLLAVGAWVTFAGSSEEAARHALQSVARTHTADPAEDEVFGLSRVHQIAITISPEEYAAMQPYGGRRPGQGGRGGPGGRSAAPSQPPVERRDDGRDKSVSSFGMTFPWAHADLIIDGKTFADVGVRYKGNASYMASANGLKRSLKIDLRQFREDNKKFHGEKKLNLHAGAMDPTKCREAIAYAVFRAAGVAAPRTAYAEVRLSVADQYTDERLGLYVVVEQIDDGFLKTHFGDSTGLLMKPERLHSFDFLGETWDRYNDRYQPEDPPTPEQSQRVIDFARLVHKSSDAEFRAQIESFLDVEAFYRYIATTALLCDYDSFLTMDHNYYVYLHPQTHKFIVFPWDMDLSMAGLPMQSPAVQMDMSLSHPHAGENKLIDRLFAVPELKARYDAIVREIVATAFTKGRLIGWLEEVEAITKPRLALDAAAAEARHEPPAMLGPPGGPPGGGDRRDGEPHPREARGQGGRDVEHRLADAPNDSAAPGPPASPGGHGGPPLNRGPDLWTFIQTRTASVEAQLAGTSSGTIPARGGPGGPGGPGPGGPGGHGGRRAVEAVLAKGDANSDGKVTGPEFLAAAEAAFVKADADDAGSLDAAGVKSVIDDVLPGPPGGMLGGLGFGPPPAPSSFMLEPLMDEVDADQDGVVTKAEWTRAAEQLVERLQIPAEGFDREAIFERIPDVLPPPPGMGPPGSGPPGFNSDAGDRPNERRSSRSSSERPTRPGERNSPPKNR